uniref:MANSC domain-containing protein n=1 Tax=Rhabditophanes sp. KR3021 TaxID=114890 RepID=A0AC35TXU0_9BILA
MHSQVIPIRYCSGSKSRFCASQLCYNALNLTTQKYTHGCAPSHLCPQTGCHLGDDNMFICCCGHNLCNSLKLDELKEYFQDFMAFENTNLEYLSRKIRSKDNAGIEHTQNIQIQRKQLFEEESGEEKEEPEITLPGFRRIVSSPQSEDTEGSGISNDSPVSDPSSETTKQHTHPPTSTTPLPSSTSTSLNQNIPSINDVLSTTINNKPSSKPTDIDFKAGQNSPGGDKVKIENLINNSEKVVFIGTTSQPIILPNPITTTNLPQLQTTTTTHLPTATEEAGIMVAIKRSVYSAEAYIETYPWYCITFAGFILSTAIALAIYFLYKKITSRDSHNALPSEDSEDDIIFTAGSRKGSTSIIRKDLGDGMDVKGLISK